MKKITLGVVIMTAAFASSLSGAEAPRGVAGVDVVVKQNPSQRAMTDARGHFAFDGIAPGTYALTFRARKAKDTKTQSSDKVTVATSYSIKVDGGKRTVNSSGLTSDKLLAGVDVSVQVTSGKIRGQVAAGELKKMVWIPQEPGSHIPGHWVPEDSPEAKRAFKTNAYGQSGDGLRRMMDRAADVHQEGGPVVDRTRDH